MSVVYQVAVACALFSVPGCLFGLAAGLRGWLAVGSGPVLTLAVAVICSAALRTLGFTWSIRTALVSSLILLVVALVPALVVRRRTAAAIPAPASSVTQSSVTLRSRTVVDHLIIGVGLLVAAGWGVRAITRVTNGLTAVDQAWDSMFHAGAIRLIATTGDTAPSALAAIGQPNNPDFFYPNIYHVVAALHLQITGAGAAVTEDATAAALPYLFVVSTVGLLAALGARTAVVLFGTVLAVSISAFPFTIIAYGALLPFAAAVASLSGIVALTEELLRRPRPSVAILTALGSIGLLFTHPSVAVVAALWCGAHLIVGIAARGLLTRRLLLSLAVLAVVAVVGALPLLGGLLATSEVAASINRDPFTDGASAVGQMWFFSTIINKPQWVAGVAVLLGLLVVARLRVLWSAFAVMALMTALYVLATAYQSNLTALWWDDPSRFAALFVPPAVLLAAFGAGALVEQVVAVIAGLWTGAAAGNGRLLTGTAAVVVIALFGWFTNGLYQERHIMSMAPSFANGPTLSSGEEAGLAYLKSQYKGGAVMNDPQDGSPYGYAIYELPMVFKAPVTLPSTPADFGKDRLMLLKDFNKLATDPAVAAAVARLDIRWVITGKGFLLTTEKREPGLTNLDQTPGLTKVFDNGASQVYKVTPPPTR